MRENESLTGLNLLACGLSDGAAAEICDLLADRSLAHCRRLERVSQTFDLCSPDAAQLVPGGKVRFNRKAGTVVAVRETRDGAVGPTLCSRIRPATMTSRSGGFKPWQSPAAGRDGPGGVDEPARIAHRAQRARARPPRRRVLADAFAKHDELRTLLGLKVGQTEADFSNQSLSASDAIIIDADFAKPRGASASLVRVNLLRNHFAEWDRVRLVPGQGSALLGEQSLAPFALAFTAPPQDDRRFRAGRQGQRSRTRSRVRRCTASTRRKRTRF